MTTANVDIPEPWIPGDDTFGARLALVRQRMGWGNVAEAAEACDIPVPSWRNWERDGRTPRNIIEISGKIAARTGCDQLWLERGRAGRLLVTAGRGTGQEPNERLALSAVRRMRKRRSRKVRPNGGARPAPATPPSSVAATQRRPMPTSGPGQRIAA